MDGQLDRIRRAVEEKVEKFSRFLKPGWSKVLDPSYVPPNPKYRETEIETLSLKLIDSIRNRVTRNIVVLGNSGSGKTMSFLVAKDIAESVLRKKGEENFRIVYTRAVTAGTVQVLVDICEGLGVRVPRRGLSVGEYLALVEEWLRRTGCYVHVCVDEFDNLLTGKHCEALLYFLTRTDDLSATLITNKIDLRREVSDKRVLSSLNTLNEVVFKPYTVEQVRNILDDRVRMVFAEEVVTDEALDVLAKRIAEEGGDIRKGLAILLLCAELLMREQRTRIDERDMLEVIEKYEVEREGEQLRATLSFSDKIILAALYALLLRDLTDRVSSEDLFAQQDYYRRLLGKESINHYSFSVYLSRLAGAGVICVKRFGKGRGKGTGSFVQLKYPRSSLRYMIERDGELAKLLPTIEEEIREARAERVHQRRNEG